MSEELEDFSGSEGAECPHCGEYSDEYPIYGKSPAPICPNCKKLVSKNDIPDELIVHKEKKTGKKSKPDKKEVREILEEEAPDLVDNDEGFFKTPKKPAAVLADVLNEFNCDESFIKMMVRRCMRMDGLHPTDLRNYLKAMKSGAKNDSEADYIADEYAYALREEEEKARMMGEMIQGYSPPIHSKKSPYKSSIPHGIDNPGPKRYHRPGHYPQPDQIEYDEDDYYDDPPKRRNPRYRGDDYYRGTPGGQHREYNPEIERLQQKVDMLTERLQRNDVHPDDIRFLVSEAIMESQQKPKTLDPEDIHKMIQDSLSEVQKQSRLDKLEEKIQKQQEQMQLQNQEFQKALADSINGMKELILQSQRPPDNVVTREELEKQRQNERIEMMERIMEIQKEQTTRQIAEMEKDRERLIEQIELERERSKPLPSSDTKWDTDSAKITADTISHLAKIVEKKSPIKEIVAGTQKLMESSKEAPKVIREAADAEGGVASLLDDEYIED